MTTMTTHGAEEMASKHVQAIERDWSGRERNQRQGSFFYLSILSCYTHTFWYLTSFCFFAQVRERENRKEGEEGGGATNIR